MVGCLTAQLVAHGSGETGDGQHKGPNFRSGTNMGEYLACQIACFDERHAPLFARLPVTVVAGIDAKAEKNRQRDTHQREWPGSQGYFPVEKLSMGNHNAE